MSNESKINGFLKIVLKDYPPPRRCLDVGARDGYMVKMMKKRGYGAVGIDVMPKNRSVMKDDILNNNLMKNGYDLVITRHCIEHCFNVRGFLSNSRDLLKDDGIFIMLFPLVQAMTYDYTKKCDNYEDEFIEETNGLFETRQFVISTKVGIDPLSKDEYLYVGVPC